MAAGPVISKAEMKSAAWLNAYEDRNVDVGLACGFAGQGADRQGHVGDARTAMAEMLKAKIAHPLAGANTAWVPSPTAATLHAHALSQGGRRDSAQDAISRAVT